VGRAASVLAAVLAAPNSTLPDVSSMNAPSSEASGVSSCSTIDADAASSPIRGASRPVTVSSPAPFSAPLTAPLSAAPRATFPPAAAIISASRSASGVRTRTDLSVLRAMTSSVLASVMSLPRPMTIRWSAVTAISFIRWLETRTVRPSAARLFIRFLIHRTPSGSSPLTGSSSSRISGLPSMATATPSRWLMPSEKPPARLSATSCRPTRASTSSTRPAGMPWVWARKSRWLRAERPGCTDLASSSAPTVCSGSFRSR
jgi:hypothetical protein